MKTIESLNNALTHDGIITSPFYFKEDSLNDIELKSNTFAGAAYPMSISFTLDPKSIRQAIKQLHERLDYARSIETDTDFYDVFEADLIKALSDLK